MKKVFLTVAAATMMSFGLQAQNGMQSFNNDAGRLNLKQNNRKVETFDGKWFRKFEVSEDRQIQKVKSARTEIKGVDSYAVYKEIKNQPSATRNNYQLKINFVGEWWQIAIGNGDDFFDLTFFDPSTPYITTVPEGYYDIVVGGDLEYDLQYKGAYYFYEQIHIAEDTELTVDMADLTHTISFAPVDANNNLISDIVGENHTVKVTLDMHHSVSMSFVNFITWYSISDISIHVNDMGNRNTINAPIHGYDIENHELYAFTFPSKSEIVEDFVFENNSEDVYNYKQIFNVPDDFSDVLYSSVAFFNIQYGMGQEGRDGWSYSRSWSSSQYRDKDTPYSLNTNTKYNDSPITGDNNSFICPLNWDFYDLEDWMNEYEGVIVGTPMAMNDNGELILNFFPKFHEISFSDVEGAVGSLGNNPITRVYNEDEYYYAGFRTPILYHQTINSEASMNPYNVGLVFNRLLFMGEYGAQKYNHGDMILKVMGDNIELFNDSLYIFNSIWGFDNSRSQYNMEIINDEIFAYGQNMVNHTVIDFDMTKSDVNPPTLTMLRIIDNEKISMSVTDASTARIEITAGDYFLKFTEFDNWPGRYWEDLAYENKPNLEVYWSADNETYHPLPVQEDETKFNIGYGNFFEVSLEPLLQTNLHNAWITVKTVLTDAVGNSQVQILEPLFFYGDLVGINQNFISVNVNSWAYPNPFTDKVTIELEKSLSGETFFEIYDMTGRIIYQQKTEVDNKKAFSWNGSYAKSGVYFYGIYNNGNIYRGKLVKQ